jgi:hypothetical protein
MRQSGLILRDETQNAITTCRKNETLELEGMTVIADNTLTLCCSDVLDLCNKNELLDKTVCRSCGRTSISSGDISLQKFDFLEVEVKDPALYVSRRHANSDMDHVLSQSKKTTHYSAKSRKLWVTVKTTVLIN